MHPACLPLIALLVAAPAAASAPAESAVAAEPSIAVPERGMSMTAVEKAYGTPLEKRPPVGDPPITRWVYPGFEVFFEYDRVIHSVVTGDGQASSAS